jgi:hypothetical protein
MRLGAWSQRKSESRWPRTEQPREKSAGVVPNTEFAEGVALVCCGALGAGKARCRHGVGHPIYEDVRLGIDPGQSGPSESEISTLDSNEREQCQHRV